MIKQVINHPEYYNIPGRKECIDEQRELFGVLPVLFFCLLNLYKYDYRKGLKTEGASSQVDYRKGRWYLDYAYNLLVRYWWLKPIIFIFFHSTYKYIMSNNKVKIYGTAKESN